MSIIAIINQKGGVGKTTTAVNLSAAIAQTGIPTLLIDLDPQANASSVLGLHNPVGPGLYEALTGSAPLPSLIQPTRIPNLSALPARLDLAGAEVEVARLDNHLFQLRNTLAPLRQSNSFHYIFLDCPPSLGILMSNALAAADQLLVPVQCEYYALEGLGLLLQVASQIRDSGANPSLCLCGLLMTMYDSRTNLNTAVVRDVRSHFANAVFQVAIPRTVRFGEAPSHGLTILEYDPHGTGSLAYRTLAAEFLQRQNSKMFFP
ncbi:MAG: ParA family protein, partial [Chthoniobacterales bacterium]|nr:ParA family protein [Chthoniobacterales bacterium]